MHSGLRQYSLITANYWLFTLTDGALRMLVVLHFHSLGYKPLDIALLFVFYEFFGVITNLVGGWLGARIGLNQTMIIGLALQIIALSMLLVPTELLIVPWVMAAQALSGIAKDLNKMSAKSAIKTLIPYGTQGKLYQWVAVITGSKNTLKGVGFFLGGALLSLWGFTTTIALMVTMLATTGLLSIFCLQSGIGKASNKPKFRDIFSKNRAINLLSAARLFLFGARDVWFVVAVPVYLANTLGWSHYQVSGFLAIWIIIYGLIQSLAPRFTGRHPGGKAALFWASALSIVPAVTAFSLSIDFQTHISLLVGLIIFGALLAINASLHSYLIVNYAKDDGASLDIGFYYMANALGRLIGTILSGWLYQQSGLEGCLWVSTLFLLITVFISMWLPHRHQSLDSLHK